jgi:TPR repeat protein
MATGICIEEDEVVREGMVSEATYWTHKVITDHGAKGKFALAKQYLGTPEARKTVYKNKQGEAVQLLKEAADEGHTLAMRWLSAAYAVGDLGFEVNAVMCEHWAREAAKKGDDEEAVKYLVSFQTAKGHAVLNICKVAGMPAPSRETVKRFVSGPLHDHSAMTGYSYFAHCLIHGECGFEKNLRLAKDLLKVSIGLVDKTLEKDPAPEKALLKELRRCPGCGKYAYWTCKLCRGVRYCSRKCQKWQDALPARGDNDTRGENRVDGEAR